MTPKQIILTLIKGSIISAVLFFSLSTQALQTEQLSKMQVMQMVIDEAIRQDMSPELALAVAKVESAFQVDALSSAGAIGVMQIMPATGRSEFGLTETQLYNPRLNVCAGIAFLKSLLRAYGRTDIALSHYNGGSAVRRADGSLRVIPATQGYVNNVISSMRQYRRSPLVERASRPRRAPDGSIDAGLDNQYSSWAFNNNRFKALDENRWRAFGENRWRALDKSRLRALNQNQRQLIASLQGLSEHNRYRFDRDNLKGSEVQTKQEPTLMIRQKQSGLTRRQKVAQWEHMYDE